MTDTRKAALSMALEYHRHVDPATWGYPHSGMGGMQSRQGGNYTPKQIVETAEAFVTFLDGHYTTTKKKRR